MPTIFDLVNAKEIGVYWTESRENRIPYLGETLFPAKKQPGLDLSWIRGSKGLPAMLQPSAFDTKATLRDRIGVSKIETEMPFFREAMRIGEKDRQELNKVVGGANAALIQPIINRIYDDTGTLIDGALVAPERMIMQLLSAGTIAITANRINYNYNYNFPPLHMEQLAGGNVWTDFVNSNPVADIQRWQDTIEGDTGVKPTRAICTRVTWGLLMNNQRIKLDLNPIGGQNIIMTDALLQQYLSTKLGIQVAVYNKRFNLAGVPTLFFPDNVFTMIPEGNLGNTYYGTTPEESDLMSGATDAEVQIVNTGVAVTTVKEPHPVNVQTIVSEIVLPSFESIDSVFIANVA